MPGWGEAKGPPPELVALRRQLEAGRELAAAARAFLDNPTTGKADTLARALDRFDAAR